MSDSAMSLMHQGGWVLWVLLLFSIATLAVGLERAIILRRSRTAPAPLLRRIDPLIGDSRLALAQEVCRRTDSPLGAMLARGLAELPHRPERVEEALEAAAQRELRRLRRGFGILVATATTAPLLGFLGTVTGMMASFQALVDAGMSDPALVALGIKEALTTTAGGLIVAIPAQLAHQSLNAQLERIEGDLESAGNHLLDRVASL